ncbi:MAG: hypothetical protein OXN96_13405, partial [Bryobacterales bacterium]|nr:hypothetical protein [Bryobacterales bacterium]
LIVSRATAGPALDPMVFNNSAPAICNVNSAAQAAAGDVVRVVGCAGMTLLVEVSPPDTDG